ncbi:MAG TPA: hypothetical protein VIJ22_06980 [Polyangiaceae bacterium]
MPRATLLLALALAACSRSSAPTPTPTPTPTPSLTPAPTPTPSPAPLCRSLADRTAEAQSLYGSSVHLATVDGTFLYVDPDHSPLFAESLRFATGVLAALRHDRIAPHELCPVSVYVYSSDKSLRAHCAPRHYIAETGRHLGIYDRDRGEVVVDLTEGPKHLSTQAHELAHVLMDADWGPAVDGQDERSPLWFRECVASLYESPVPDKPTVDIHGQDDWRYEQLREAVTAQNPEVHLGALFGMSDRAFRGKSDAGDVDGTEALLHRAMARAVCQWLDGKGKDQLWRFYRGWRDAGAADPDGVATFTRITGHAPTDEETDKAWLEWVGRRTW